MVDALALASLGVAKRVGGAVLRASVPALLVASQCLAAAPIAALPAAEAAGTPVAASLVVLPADTELELELANALSSRTNQRGDRVELRLAEPVRRDGQLLIPSGSIAVGEVVHADRAKAGGQAGELVFAARYLLWQGRRLPLRATQAGSGRSRTGSALGVAVAAGLAGFLVRGGEIEVPAGSPFRVKLREPAELPVIPELGPPATPAAPETTPQEVEE